jgi:hypothetical protein
MIGVMPAILLSRARVIRETGTESASVAKGKAEHNDHNAAVPRKFWGLRLSKGAFTSGVQAAERLDDWLSN